MNKTEDIAVFVTGPTAITLSARIDIKRGVVIIVKGAQAFECGADRPERHITANDRNNVIGFFDLLDNGVVRQETPVGRSLKVDQQKPGNADGIRFRFTAI